MTLSACQVSSDPSVRPYLPNPPSEFGVPVPVPAPVAKQSAKALAAQLYAVIAADGRRLLNDKSFQVDVWARFSNPGMKK